MMRSMYSAVSGLKTHQTRMDVIGNNIANVNTVAFKSSSVTFSDILYQTTSNASGANATTGTGGVNAKQIGLGTTAAATKVSITSAGASETTGNPFDIRLTDKNSTNFFIVNNGSENVFTRSGSFYVDGSGNLCMSSTGYTVMGWQVDETTGEIRKDTVSALRIMQEKNLTSAPEATTQATIAGVLDENDTDVKNDAGRVMNLNFYDNLGYQYTAKFAIKSTGTDGKYTVELTSVLDSNNQNIIKNLTKKDISQIFGDYQADATLGQYGLSKDYEFKNNKYVRKADNKEFEVDNADKTLFKATDGSGDTVSITEIFSGITTTIANNIKNGTNNYKVAFDQTTGQATVTGERTSYDLVFDTSTGKFASIGGDTPSKMLNMSVLSSGLLNRNGNFQNITVDFSQCLNYENGGKSTIGADAGATDGKTGKGRKLGAMTGIFIDTSGRIYGTYDNGNTELLGQIAVAQFSNASGLEKVGESCYRTTLNSGEFDGIGVEISADGSSMTTGELEMSNVDLSSEFTSMITTQRGFQANSRVITTSDTLLEELVNLKR
ncbi:flagellar hook protein FlgE [Roseburia inulinivorans]|uniref:Flagellar hook protein FlgE n=1 Tax=Roseburia inulinivorans TaxID=360807 RepID=A0A3R5VWK8_9FIRM|nr:flagellar hook-basal body complex protein [Roseburia inulinivorans]RGQ53686.1 flagellar hook-basal body complex protein [Roseburia inulinivorans]